MHSIHIDYLPSKQTINDDYYVALLDHFNNILKKKMFPFGEEESALASRQCTALALPHTCLALMTKFNEFSYELFSQFPVYSPDLAATISCFQTWRNGFRRKEIHHRRAAHCQNRGLFWRVGQIILFGRLKKVENSLDQVYRAERREIKMWEIKIVQKKCCVLLCFSKNLLTCPHIYYILYI